MSCFATVHRLLFIYFYWYCIQHLQSPENNEETYFDFNEENYERVNRVLRKYPDNYRQAGIIPLLDLAQRQNGGWLPLAAMDKVAQICHVAPVRVYEVASFYTMFNRTPVGKYFLQVCGTTPCMICGSEEIMQTIQDNLGIKNGGTSEDGRFTLLEVECLGACANAPMVQINDDYYECLSKDTMIELLELMKQDKLPPVGKWGSLPMNGQVSCEGPLGKSSLWKVPPSPKVAVDRFKEGKVDPASVKKHMAY
jgi:NADH dehydrogenase (ubiquinone) flavoprotein 2